MPDSRLLPVSGTIRMPPGITVADVTVTYLGVLRGGGLVSGGTLKAQAGADGVPKVSGGPLQLQVAFAGDFVERHPYARFGVSYRGAARGYEFDVDLALPPEATAVDLTRTVGGLELVSPEQLASVQQITAGFDAAQLDLSAERQAVAQALADTAQTTEQMRSVAGTYTLGREPQAGDPAGTYRVITADGPVDVAWDGQAVTGRTPALATPEDVANLTRTAAAAPDALTASLQAAGDGETVVFPAAPVVYTNNPSGTSGEQNYGPLVLNSGATFFGGSLRPQRKDKRGLAFQGGSPALEKMRFVWDGYSARTAEGVVFHGPDAAQPDAVTDSPLVLFSESKYAPGAGFIGFTADHERYLFSKVISSMADGFHSANGFNPLQIGLWADDCGDDPFAFIDYAHRRESLYGHTHAVTARLGQARGIVRGGWGFSTAVGFILDRMRVGGVYHVHESTPDWSTRQPHHHITVGGVIYGTGNVAWRQASQSTRPPAIASIISHGERVSLYSDILCDISENNGLDIEDGQDLYFDNIILRSSANVGARLLNSRVRCGRLIVEGAGDVGLILAGTTQLEADTIILKNVARNRADGIALVVEPNASLRVGRLIIERDDPAAGIGYALYGTGQIDDLSWQVVGGAEPSGLDANGMIRQRQGRPRKALIPLTIRQTAPGGGIRIPLAEAGRIVRVTTEQEGAAQGAALVGYEIYGDAFSSVRQGNPEFAAGPTGQRRTYTVNDAVAAGETVHVRWLRQFQDAQGVVGTQPTAMHVTVWFQPD